MPKRDQRKLKRSKEAKANREGQRRYAERQGEAYKEVKRARAALSYYRKRVALLKGRLQRGKGATAVLQREAATEEAEQG